MSVLEALLPIASASLSPKEGSVRSSPRAEPVSKESAVKPVEQGPQKKAPDDREEQGNAFARVLDERLQTAEPAAPAFHLPSEIDDAIPVGGNAGGMVLPLQGEALPPEQVVVAPVEVRNDGLPQEDSNGQPQQAPAIFVMSGQGEIAAPTRVEVPAAQNTLAATGSQPTAEPAVNEANKLSAEETPVQAVVLPMADVETPVQTLANAQALTGKDVEALVQQDAAQRVRDWRGLSLNPQGEWTGTVRADGSVVQVVPLANGGQLQQFADSLRQGMNQELAAVSAASERGTSSSHHAPSGTAELTSWRADTAGATSAGSVRGTLTMGSFSQVLQGEMSGQALGERVGDHAWSERVSQRVALMLGQKISSAHIQLDPPELGAMNIKVSLHGDQASVSFHSAHAVVRDALEQSFPRLQEMLNQQGLQLVDAQVSDRQPSGHGGFGQSGNAASGSAAPPDQDEILDNMQSRSVQLVSGLIDFYA